jgi:hypothetical protein
MMSLRNTFWISDLRLLIGGAATPFVEKGQRRLSSINQKSAVKNRQLGFPC